MPNDKYNMSFTTGGLFRSASLKAAALYLEKGSWDAVRGEMLEKNLLQARTLSTLKRERLEVVSRLKTLHPEELRFLVEAGYREQGYLLWIAVCRRYAFIAEFATEVVRERYLSLMMDVNPEDFDAFFNAKSEWRPELLDLRPTTRKKLRQVLFKILRESELLTAENTIIPAMLDPKLAELLSKSGRNEISLFPVFESDLKGVTQ